MNYEKGGFRHYKLDFARLGSRDDIDDLMAKVRDFIQWAEKRLEVYPERLMFQYLISAYTFLGQEGERCRVIRTGARMYPLYEPFQKAKALCGQ